MKKNRRKILTYSVISLVVILAIAIGGILAWTNNTYAPIDMFYELVPQEDYTKVKDFYVFEPKVEQKGVGIVLYPGALVEPLAYGYYANELSKEGYLVAIPEVTFNLSITEGNKAKEFIDMNPRIEEWYVGGHSMGGVSASLFAEDNQEDIKGVILLGAYPASSTNLADNSIKVLSIYGEKDGLTTLDDIEKSKENLPDTAIFEEIKGGNHAQFGMYGIQKGDNPAGIEVLEQQEQMIKATLAFLRD